MAHDEWGIAEGADKLALHTVIKALVASMNASSPQFRSEVTSKLEEYLTQLDQQSELELAFADRARASLATLLKA